jgi:hypothetical protein
MNATDQLLPDPHVAMTALEVVRAALHLRTATVSTAG